MEIFFDDYEKDAEKNFEEFNYSLNSQDENEKNNENNDEILFEEFYPKKIIKFKKIKEIIMMHLVMIMNWKNF